LTIKASAWAAGSAGVTAFFFFRGRGRVRQDGGHLGPHRGHTELRFQLGDARTQLFHFGLGRRVDVRRPSDRLGLQRRQGGLQSLDPHLIEALFR
jgi:hypothetical protein